MPEGAAPRRRRPWIGPLVGVVLSAAFVALLLRGLSVKDIERELRQVDLAVLGLAIPLRGVGLLMQSLRSKVLLAPLGTLSLGRVFRSVLVGIVGNHVLPFRIGELLRLDYVARFGGIPHSACLAVVGIERMLDLGCLLAFGLSAVGLASRTVPFVRSLVFVALGLGLAVVTLAVVLGRPSRPSELAAKLLGRVGPALLGARISAFVADKLRRFQSGLATVADPRRVALGVLTTAGLWTSSALAIHVWLLAFGVTLPWYAPGVVLLFLAFGSALPATPGFIGTYHYFVASGLAVFDLPPAQAASVALVGHAVAIVPVTVFGIAVLFGDFLRGDILPKARPGVAA